MEAESLLPISHSGLASRWTLHAFQPGLSQRRLIPTVIYTIPQSEIQPCRKGHLSSFPISSFGVKTELTLGTSMGFDRSRVESELVSATVLLVFSDRGSLRVVKGCSWHASLLAAGRGRTNM